MHLIGTKEKKMCFLELGENLNSNEGEKVES